MSGSSNRNQSTPFGSTAQQTQPACGNNNFGTTTTPAIGTTTPSAFGSLATPAIGPTTSLFGGSSTPTFGSTSTTTPGSGASTTPSFCTPSSAFSFGQSGAAIGSTPFRTTPPSGSQTSPFGRFSRWIFTLLGYVLRNLGLVVTVECMSPPRSGQVENGHHASSEPEAEAVARHVNGASTEKMMPKLSQAGYYTEPSLEELAAKERAQPGYRCQVRDFVVGRQGYGSIKFLGETDVRGLDLEAIVKFNFREVVVYKEDSEKPPVGEGLNKAAVVTLLNIKCKNRETGEPCTEGPRLDRFKEMLVNKAKQQGAEMVSFDGVKGEWKFSVKHFSSYGFGES